MTSIQKERNNMTPQISPKDIPQDRSESEEEEEPVYDNIVQESSSSGEDEDEEGEQIDPSPLGYIPLSMNDASDASQVFSQQLEEENNGLENENHETLMNDSDGNEAAAGLSNTQYKDASKEFPMDNDQVSLIQQVMVKVSLPPSSVPEWANVIPEEKWKNSLLTSLQKRTHSSLSKTCNPTDPENDFG